MVEVLKGIYPALMTGFDCNGAFDQKVTAALAKKLMKEHVDGLYVGGSSGEMLLCTVEERKAFLETVKDVCGHGKIIAHVGAMSTNDSVALAIHAAQVKADAISSVTPFYYKYSFEEIKQFYVRLCEVSGLPMIIYNIPATTGTTLTYDQLAELLSIPGVAGMKFTSSDFFLLNRLKTNFPDKVIYNGSDEMLLSGLAAGADGGIGTTYNFMPELMVAIYRLFGQNRMKEAYQVQSLANRVIAEVLRYGVLPATKEMIGFAGLAFGICREPLLPLSEDAKHTLYNKGWLPLVKGKEELAQLLTDALYL